jgi:ASC-1-like (ASCH) protein
MLGLEGIAIIVVTIIMFIASIVFGTPVAFFGAGEDADIDGFIDGGGAPNEKWIDAVWWKAIKDGSKTVEGRLNRSFWSKCAIGDIIILINRETEERLTVEVTNVDKSCCTFSEAYTKYGKKLLPHNGDGKPINDADEAGAIYDKLFANLLDAKENIGKDGKKLKVIVSDIISNIGVIAVSVKVIENAKDTGAVKHTGLVKPTRDIKAKKEILHPPRVAT